MCCGMERFGFSILRLLVFAGGIRSGVLAFNCGVPTYATNLTQERFLAYLTAPCRYDRYVLPESSTPLNVTVKVDVRHLEVVQAQFTAYLTVQLTYENHKLKFEKFATSRSIIFGDKSVEEKIWTPRLQLKDKNETIVISHNKEDVFVSIDKTGLVTYSYKIVTKFYCLLDLTKFPFDAQKCSLSFGDWSYNNSRLKLQWNSIYRPTFARNIRFTEFVVDEIEYTVGTHKISSFSAPVEDFSELIIKFTFHRNYGYYLLIFFIPSFLLVFTAWVTFWLQADAGPPRAILGASTVVAFVTLHLGVSKDIPKVSYVKASDIWFLGVSFFIFFSLAEFAFVNVIWRRKKTVELKKPKPRYIFKSALMPSKSREDLRRYESQISVIKPSAITQRGSFNGYSRSLSQEALTLDQSIISIAENEPVQVGWATMTPQEVAIYIDRKARIIFPLCFLIFNMLYWFFVCYR